MFWSTPPAFPPQSPSWGSGLPAAPNTQSYSWSEAATPESHTGSPPGPTSTWEATVAPPAFPSGETDWASPVIQSRWIADVLPTPAVLPVEPPADPIRLPPMDLPINRQPPTPVVTPVVPITIVCVRAQSLRDMGLVSPTDKQPFLTWVANPNNMYVGRLENHVGAVKSRWNNKHSVAKLGLAESLRRYEEDIRNSVLFSELGQLAGKNLGCWCYSNSAPTGEPPFLCHCDILVKLFRERFPR